MRTLPLNTISASSVHLWCVSISGRSSDTSEQVNCLSREERERAGRFHADQDRERYLISHGMLRTILASYVGKEPRSLCFRKSETGKPELERGPGEPCITFNLSHSAEMMLVGVARDRRIGVDVELISPRIDFLRIAERYFTVQEAGLLRDAPADQQVESFFRMWTDKEAYLKAIGCGLGGELHCCHPRETLHPLRMISGIAVHTKSYDQWTQYSMKPAAAYVASIAVDNGIPDLVLYKTDPDGSRIMGFTGAVPEMVSADCTGRLTKTERPVGGCVGCA